MWQFPEWTWSLYLGVPKSTTMQSGRDHLRSEVPNSPCQEAKHLPASHQAESVLGPLSVLAPRSALGLSWVFSRSLEVIILPIKQKPQVIFKLWISLLSMWMSGPFGWLCSIRDGSRQWVHAVLWSFAIAVVHRNLVLPSEFYGWLLISCDEEKYWC